MLTAVIESENDTLLVELPKGVFDLQMNLMSIGVRFPPNEIPLRDEESSSLRVKLYGQNEIGQKLCLLLSETDMLSTANLAAYLLTNAEPAVKDAIEAQLQVGQYRTAQELIADIKDKTLDAGPVKLALYFPIIGYLDDGEDPAYEVSKEFLYRYRYDISDLLRDYQSRDIENMAAHYHDDDGVKAKLVSAFWTRELFKGDLMFGRVSIRIREELTEDELKKLKDWVWGQNSDGAFESLEDHPIETGYGDLAISLWHDGDDYFVCDRAELDEYMAQQSSLKMGGM